MKLSNADVQEILKLLDASPYDEIKLETDRFKLTLRRSRGGAWTQSGEVLARPGVEPSAAPQESAGTVARTEPAGEKGLVDVCTPLPGTFYRAPQPGAPPFVDVGSEVEENTVICIMETMKLMNSIHAGARGTVAEICRENAQFAEKGTVLMRIRPAAQ